MALRIGLNLVHVVPRSGGTLTHARELIGAMLAVEPATELVAFVGGDVAPELRVQPWSDRVRWLRVPSAVGRGPVRSAMSLYAQWVAEATQAARLRLDVLHGLASAVAPLSPVPTVATVHDLTWIHAPGTMSTRDTMAMRVVTEAAVHRADRIDCISRAVADDVVATLRADPAKLDVVPNGIRPPTLAPTPGPELRTGLGLGDGPLVLCVAQKRVHKNLDALVRAIGHVPEARLVLPGTPTPYEADLRELARERGVEDRVTFVDWVTPRDLEGLYAAASVFVLPSRMEGFGLPILEAMVRGVPVACSNVSALPEVAGDAALLFNPSDDAAIANAIRRVLSTPALAANLAARGRERAACFTWERTAQLTFDSYRRAIAQRLR